MLGIDRSRLHELLRLFQVTSHWSVYSINDKFDKQFSVGIFACLIQMNHTNSTQVVTADDVITQGKVSTILLYRSVQDVLTIYTVRRQ